MGSLRTPHGQLITGTMETVPGVALIGGAVRLPDGTFDIDYAGGTDIDWDNQRTIERNLERVFVCDDGEEWLESQLILVEDEEA